MDGEPEKAFVFEMRCPYQVSCSCPWHPSAGVLSIAGNRCRCTSRPLFSAHTSGLPSRDDVIRWWTAGTSSQDAPKQRFTWQLPWPHTRRMCFMYERSVAVKSQSSEDRTSCFCDRIFCSDRPEDCTPHRLSSSSWTEMHTLIHNPTAHPGG